VRTALLAIDALIFAALAALHVHWAFGGRWASDGVVPDRGAGSAAKVFVPGKAITLLVAAALTAAGAVAVARVVLPAVDPIRYALGAVGVLFLLRAIGERRYVGLFKRVRGTTFAKNDDRIFVPLCLFIGSTALFGAF
jgi:hypothetical protein